MITDPLVSIIIVNWNGIEVLKYCLESLLKLDYPNWELIFVDNGSSDGSEKLPHKIKLDCQRKVFINNRNNKGFAEANNQGLIQAKGEYVLFLNNDTKVEKNLLSALVNQMKEDPYLGVIQPKIVLMDKPSYLDNAGSFLTRTGFLEHWGFMELDGSGFNNAKEIFSAKGACMLCRTSVINKVGLFDSSFISYMEETDFCWRVWLVGYKVLYYPGVKILHKVGFTSKKQDQISVNYHSYKNRLTSLIKNLQLNNLFLIGGCHLLIIIFLALYYSMKLQFNKSQMILGAICWNAIHLREILIKRSIIQSYRKISDKDLFPIIIHPINFRVMFSHFVKVEANFKK